MKINLAILASYALCQLLVLPLPALAASQVEIQLADSESPAKNGNSGFVKDKKWKLPDISKSADEPQMEMKDRRIPSTDYQMDTEPKAYTDPCDLPEKRPSYCPAII